ncbi:TetR/AcrR family transcriptional regulator [Brevibacillus sp. FSL K6-0770]|uniref:TetR family transcriptional regulator n=1 Tax=Brevibacillus parabrevis TaxID=54914 RepID=A0A4Y3PMA4_BREPA|nr:TetR/AcrR family transcriptional regulator [Brevibacillus parabrevis]RNB93614.1 TetR/AcrR family transcriptional regulator [Brevibacillus parabrevis]GEB31561.1 TetR family transcriptional regulator [Brevibacillus parabrevis]
MTTRDKIKAVALTQFAKGGYEGTPLSAITKEVGVTTPAVYAFFGSKEDLFLSIFEDVLSNHYHSVKSAIEQAQDGTVEERLYQILRGAFTYHVSQEEETIFYKRAMMFPPASLEDKLKERFGATEEMLTQEIRALLAEGIAAGVIADRPLDDLLDGFLCLMDGLFLQLLYYDESKFEHKLQNIWKLFWSGIAGS